MTKIQQTQMQMTVEGLKSQPLTMLMLSNRLGIERANLCRYISRLQRSNNVALVKKSYCKVTNHIAGYYTSNPELFPKNPQLNLF
jgi:hypothetical protein